MFRAIQHLGDVPEREMFRTFNMGIGFVLVVPEKSAEKAVDVLEASGEEPELLGEITRGKERVTLGGLL
jgi:phosphoribosylformylglycinamidine cyclo-ligase